MQKLREVVITGMGAITVAGDWTLQSGVPESKVRLNSGVLFRDDFKLGNYLTSSKTYLDRCSSLALAGCALALGDAQVSFPLDDETSLSFGITLGTHLGCLTTMKAFWDKIAASGVRGANSILFSHSYFNSPISLCAIEWNLRGYHATFCAREASGLEAARAAFDAIRLGHADAMLCGGVEAASAERELFEPQSPEDSQAEAAAFFVLESADFADARGAARRVSIVESAFENLDFPAARERFGDCGGATSALALALAFNR